MNSSREEKNKNENHAHLLEVHVSGVAKRLNEELAARVDVRLCYHLFGG